jgi:hypothetical protein
MPNGERAESETAGAVPQANPEVLSTFRSSLSASRGGSRHSSASKLPFDRAEINLTYSKINLIQLRNQLLIT